MAKPKKPRPSRARGTGGQSPRRKGGTPAHRPTKKLRSDVAGMAAHGSTHDVIAYHLNIDPTTLRRHYAVELDGGKNIIDGAIANTLAQKALKGDTSSIIFYAKTRMNYRETSEVAHTGDVVIEVKRGRADGSATVETVGPSVTPVPDVGGGGA